MRGKLSDVKIKHLKPGPKLAKYADGGGLTLVVTPSGGKNWWFRYRFEGKEQTLSLGTYPVVTLLEARERHLAAKRELEAGRNPTVVKQAQKTAAMSFEQAAMDFLTSRREHGYSEQAIDDIQGRLKKHLFPALEARPLGEITARELLEVLLALRRLGIEETARRCRQYVSQVFQFAIVRGWADRNPAADLQGIPELRKTNKVRHQRAVKTPAELGRLLLDIETISDTLPGKALELAPYVFVRAGELAGARWAEIDMASSLHGFKSCASTFLREQGYNLAWIEIQLAHGERNKVIAAYNHADYIPQRQDMMQSWADYLDSLRESAKVG